jgi:hypothetical protein
LGGGIFQQNEMHFTLFGESHEFGKFDIDIVNKHINNKETYWELGKQTELTFDIDVDRVETDADAF